MKKSGAFLTVYALEQLGVTHTFGIPGVHNIEIYDALDRSEKITPILVTHENSATFMADGIARTTGKIGVAVIVPAAGLTNGMSGIGEAYLDGIPIMVISGGIRQDSGKHYQLHQMDQGKLLDGIIKKYFLVKNHADIIPTVYEAYNTAISGEPGPVFIEIPAELQLFEGEASLFPYIPSPASITVSDQQIHQAALMLSKSLHPGIYVGWGAVDACKELKTIAELLGAPVATTLQGLSSFSSKHPLHTGVGFGPSSPPAAENAFKTCDCLLAVGVRFSELATGSYGMNIPENLIHIDINHHVFNKNYPAKIAIHGDARATLEALRRELQKLINTPKSFTALANQIQKDKKEYFNQWLKNKQKTLVSPGFFYQSLRRQMDDDALVVLDDGTHTFMTAELLPIHHPRHFISPTDFNCMGYCVPASIAVKLAHPESQVIAIVGDGAFLMTGLELVTAATHNLGIIFFVFHDGELGQISQFQVTPLNRKACTIIGDIQLKGIAEATHVEFLSLPHDDLIDEVIKKAIEISRTNRPVLVDVKIDYPQKTRLTKGVIKTNLGRFPLKEKVRFIARAIKRHTVG